MWLYSTIFGRSKGELVVLSLLCLPLAAASAPVSSSTFSEIMSFSIPRSPSGLFFDEDDSSLLYVLCGTRTNGNHHLFAFTTNGIQQCHITIPESVGMSRVDGFYITHHDGKAYIVDSQGPIYANTVANTAANGAGRLGGSVYQVDWTNPCGCDMSGTCNYTNVEWIPTVTQQWNLSPTNISDTEGGGDGDGDGDGGDEYFRNSGIVVLNDNTFLGVNGVHRGGSPYPKSIVQVDMTISNVIQSWPFDATTIGRDIDMEGLTCGPDQCVSTVFIGDEYNYIYQFDFTSTTDGQIIREWDLNNIVNVNRADRGIEALAFASTTGYFYAGIQDTATIHVLQLDGIINPLEEFGAAATMNLSGLVLAGTNGTNTTTDNDKVDDDQEELNDNGTITINDPTNGEDASLSDTDIGTNDNDEDEDEDEDCSGGYYVAIFGCNGIQKPEEQEEEEEEAVSKALRDTSTSTSTTTKSSTTISNTEATNKVEQSYPDDAIIDVVEDLSLMPSAAATRQQVYNIFSLPICGILVSALYCYADH